MLSLYMHTVGYHHFVFATCPRPSGHGLSTTIHVEYMYMYRNKRGGKKNNLCLVQKNNIIKGVILEWLFFPLILYSP